MITQKDILEATSGKLLQGGPATFRGIAYDSRLSQRGDIFVALSGERTDGHKHLELALQKCSGAIVSKRIPRYPRNKTVILVKNTHRALVQIGRYLRQKYDISIVGITGSSGKTTTKEMIAAVLSQKFRVFKNEGNLNTEIGIPVSLGKLTQKHQIGVVEMAMQGRGEIRQLAEMIRPKIAVITNIGPAHIEFLKTLTNIARAKSELIDSLPPNGVAILPADDNYLPTLRKASGNRKVITFGLEQNADVRATDIRLKELSIQFSAILKGGKRFRVVLRSPGLHMVRNALATITVAQHFDISPSIIQQALRKFRAVGSRFAIQQRKGLVVIRDEYNANPDSMRYALETLAHLGKSLKRPTIAVLGDMLELGQRAKKYHQDVGRDIRQLRINHTIAVGNNSKYYIHNAKPDGASLHVSDAKSAAKELQQILHKNRRTHPIILFKGSRGMHLEEVVKLAGI